MGSTTSGALWGGRFSGGPADALAELSRSTHFDWWLATLDVAASMAHAQVLHRAGLLDAAEHEAMAAALGRLLEDVTTGAIVPAPDEEDLQRLAGLLDALDAVPAPCRRR